VPEVSRFIVFPTDPDSTENESVIDQFLATQTAPAAGHTHTKNFMATHTQAGSLYELVEAPRLPECHCGCGRRIVGKQKYATTACQVRAWRAAHGGGKRPETTLVLTACRDCQGWKLGNGEPFTCESCADPDAPYHYSELLRLSPVPAESVDPIGRVIKREEPPIRYVRIFLGTAHLYSRRVDDEWTEVIAGLDEPVVRAMIEALGGHDNLIPTARLVEEAERQFQARSGRVIRCVASIVEGEPTTELGKAARRDREVWARQPLIDELRSRQNKDSQEQNERVRVKYAHLVREYPELFA
jgi:hypothetical protein